MSVKSKSDADNNRIERATERAAHSEKTHAEPIAQRPDSHDQEKYRLKPVRIAKKTAALGDRSERFEPLERLELAAPVALYPSTPNFSILR